MNTEAATPLQKVGTIQVDTLGEKDRLHAFFMIMPQTTTYVMRNGNKVVFRMGAVPAFPALPAFVTKIAGYVDELLMEIRNGHPEIHQKEGFETVAPEDLDPLNAVKQQAVADFLKSEEFKKLLLQEKGVGTPADSETVQPAKLTGIANTATVGEAAGESSSVAGPVTLGALKS